MSRPGAALLALALAVWSSPLFAADPPSAEGLKEHVSSLLDGFPAETPAKRDALCVEILKGGPAAIEEICARVLPPGKGDDAKARFAVNGLAVCAGRPGAESDRAKVARAILGSVAVTRDLNVAAFLLSQVQLVGGQESIRPLERYLVDDKLAGPAAAALVAIGGPEATEALRRAVDQAPRDARLALVQALGEARSREVGKLLPLADSADEDVRQAALFALANTGDPAAGPALSRSRVAASYPERAQAPSLYLLYARRLAETGRTPEALAAARAVRESYRGPGESQHASDALALVVSIEGPHALPDLLAAASSSDRRFRGSALLLAEKIPGSEATLRWVETARQAPSDVRADIVAMLGRRGDVAALPFARESLTSGDEAVRLAAIPAASRLGGAAVLPDLLPLLGSAGAPESAALKTALLGYPAGLVVPEAIRLLDPTPLPAKAVLIEVLGEKRARGEIERVYRLADDPDPAISEPSLRALADLATEADLSRLVSMLEKSSESDRVVRLREAIAAVVLRNPDPDTRADGLVALLESATVPGKIEILKVLPRVGGANPLRAAVEMAASPEAGVRSAAIGALSRWPDATATDALLGIARVTATREHFRSALQGYVRLVGRAATAPDQKSAAIEKALALPGDDADKKGALLGLAAFREPESLGLLARYLDHEALRDVAAAALLDLASEQSPEERWLSGHEAYSVLRRAEASLADPAAQERAGKIIEDRLKQAGFVPLFGGRSLEGGKGLAAEADETMRAHWRAEGGVLAFDGKGEGLLTTGDHGDFELLVDWKIEKGGDGGILLRGASQVLISDAEADPAGSGGLFNKQKGPSPPLERADRPAGQWNAFRILMIGERVTVYLNDKRVVDSAVLENPGERDKPTYPSGPIVLQAHGHPLAFRNVFIRDIPRDAEVPQLTAAEASEGFTPVFNGHDLEGWTGDGGGYAAEDGKIVVHPERAGGNLYTKKEYTDFVLRFDFKLTPAANNGLGIRAPREGDAAYAGMELQILEDGSPVYWSLKPYQYHGSIYGVVPARRGVLRPPGEWNSEEVTVKGRRVAVVVNGEAVVDADIDAASAGGTRDHKDHPGLKRESGHIGFLGHGSIVEFRNIRIKETP